MVCFHGPVRIHQSNHALNKFYYFLARELALGAILLSYLSVGVLY